MMMKVSPERKDRYIQVLMDNLTRSTEEMQFMDETISDLRDQVKQLFQENSMLRHRMQEAGLTIPVNVVEAEIGAEPVSK